MLNIDISSLFQPSPHHSIGRPTCLVFENNLPLQWANSDFTCGFFRLWQWSNWYYSCSHVIFSTSLFHVIHIWYHELWYNYDCHSKICHQNSANCAWHLDQSDVSQANFIPAYNLTKSVELTDNFSKSKCQLLFLISSQSCSFLVACRNILIVSKNSASDCYSVFLSLGKQTSVI